MSYNNKTIGLIIPTRMNSERLPGKALIDINGKPNLERIIERASHSRYLDNIILAVSETEGKEIEKWFFNNFPIPLTPKKNYCFEYGSHEHIYKRTLTTAQNYNLDIIVDTSHCCSFLDWNIIDGLIELLFEYNADFATNIIPRSFPDGFDIYVYTREIYQKVYVNSPHWNQYWTGWNIWHCREDLKPKPRIVNMQTSSLFYYPHWNLTLDTEEELNIIRKIYEHFGESPFTISQIINYIRETPYLYSLVDDSKMEPTKLEKEPC